MSCLGLLPSTQVPPLVEGARKHARRLQTHAAPGVIFHADEAGNVRQCCRSVKRLRRWFNQIELSPEIAEARIDALADGELVVNAELLGFRLEKIGWTLDRLLEGAGKPRTRPRILLAYTDVLNAGARLVRDEPVVVIHTGLLVVERWRLLREALPRATSDNADPTNFTAPVYLLMAFRGCGRSITDRRVEIRCRRREEELWASLSGIQAEISRNRDARATSWEMAEAFALAHEIAHIALGHLEEIDRLQRDATLGPSAEARCQSRRIEMEFEADGYALPFAASTQAVLRGRDAEIIQNPYAEPGWRGHIASPLHDLMLISELGNRRRDRRTAAQLARHPRPRHRLRELLHAMEEPTHHIDSEFRRWWSLLRRHAVLT